MNGEPIKLSRDCPVTTIPYGEKTMLHEGDSVVVVQQLGGSVTVYTPSGNLVRIDGEDADAIGLTIESVTTNIDMDAPFDMAKVTDALSTIYDPEIPVNIVDLGLIYRCDEVLTERGTRRIEIDMTMTAPGCGMGDVLQGDAIRILSTIPGIDDVEVNIVWDPPWNVGHMSDAARLQLGML